MSTVMTLNLTVHVWRVENSLKICLNHSIWKIFYNVGNAHLKWFDSSVDDLHTVLVLPVLHSSNSFYLI